MNQYALIILSVAGIFVSSYIAYKKYRDERLVCYLGNDCNVVVHSKYNRILFGVPNEYLGIAFFVGVLFAIVLPFFGIHVVGPLILPFAVFGATAGASLFSLVLVFIQLRVLKEWCEYCLMSTLIVFLMLVVQLI